MVNNGNNFRQITTVKGIGSNPVMPAVKIQGVAVFAATFSLYLRQIYFLFIS
jgi:hypothetical protein